VRQALLAACCLAASARSASPTGLALSSTSSQARPATDDKLVAAWRYKRDVMLVECAQRHYDLAKWCWVMTLRAQSATELLVSLEVSLGRFRPAKTELEAVRKFNDENWKKLAKPPNPTLLRNYESRAKTAREQDARSHIELAQWAYAQKLTDEARAVYDLLLKRSGRPLEVDADERLRLPSGVVPADISKTILASAIEINGKRYLRDEYLQHLPDVGAIFEVQSETLRVRSPISAELVAHLHALGTALSPLMESDLGGRPTQRMELFVFATRSTFEAYLESAGLATFKSGSGVADRKTYTAVVCAEGADMDALVIHEIAHLYQYGVTRGVMPDWYSEGFAETYGGNGSFTWNGKELKVGGILSPQRLALLADPSKLYTIQALFAAHAPALWDAADKESALRFYTESWALMRFFRNHAGPETGARFARWESMCAGAAVGAQAEDLRARDPAAAQALFAEVVAADLSDIERRFREYVAALK
jgi:hypothetical protein